MNRHRPLTTIRTEMTPILLQQNTRPPFSIFPVQDGAHCVTELAPVIAPGDFDGIITTCACSCGALAEKNRIGKDVFYNIRAACRLHSCGTPSYEIYLAADKNPDRDTLSSVLDGAGVLLRSLKMYPVQANAAPYISHRIILLFLKEPFNRKSTEGCRYRSDGCDVRDPEILWTRHHYLLPRRPPFLACISQFRTQKEQLPRAALVISSGMDSDPRINASPAILSTGFVYTRCRIFSSAFDTSNHISCVDWSYVQACLNQH
ncbi:hypothetical protein IW262DRAFT_1401131 [Armillaria fumosa]|nr:hypothetical protein IW262DRAFT_1401131 [Armillaria fumosa]